MGRVQTGKSQKRIRKPEEREREREREWCYSFSWELDSLSGEIPATPSLVEVLITGHDPVAINVSTMVSRSMVMESLLTSGIVVTGWSVWA